MNPECFLRVLPLFLAMLILYTPAYTVVSPPSLLVLANSVDYSLAGGLFDYLEAEGVNYTLIQLPGDELNPECLDEDMARFDEVKAGYRVILILGGHKAYGCVGFIVGGILNESEKRTLEREGSVAVFVKRDVWAEGQTVLVAAGNTRNETCEAHLYCREMVRDIVKYTLLYVIPHDLDGYPDPYSVWEPPGSDFNNVTVPGGYSSRVWLIEGETFVVAAVLDMGTEDKAIGAYRNLSRGHNETSIDIGEEGFYDEENSSLGTVGFRLVGFRRGRCVAIVGGGILSNTSTPPSRSLLTDLARRIDDELQHNIRCVFEGDIALILSVQAVPPVRHGGGELQAPIGAPVKVTSKTIKVNMIGAGANQGKRYVGYIKLRFNVSEIGRAMECPEGCPYLEVRVYIMEIHIDKKADDGDDRLFRDGCDPMIGGTINLYFKCHGELLEAKQLRFVTAQLRGLDGKGHTITEFYNGRTMYSIRKYINKTTGCADEITVTCDLLLRDSDDGDLADILNVIVSLALKKAGAGKAAGAVPKQINTLKKKGRDTTGPKPFQILRSISGNDVGEAHLEQPTKIYPPEE